MFICNDCHALSNLICPDCDGKGRIQGARYMSEKNRPVLLSTSCRSCMSTGKVACGGCLGIGAMRCGACRGLGHIKCDCSVAAGYANED